MGGNNDNGRVAFPVYVPIHPKFSCVSNISVIIFIFIYLVFYYLFIIYYSFIIVLVNVSLLSFIFFHLFFI